MIMGVTGHRELGHTPEEIRERFLEMILKHKPTKVITGMAIGFDTIVAQVCVEFGIPFIAAVPFENQDSIWPQADRDIYRELLTHAEAGFFDLATHLAISPHGQLGQDSRHYHGQYPFLPG